MMKRHFYFLLLLLATGLVGCNNANKTDSNDGTKTEAEVSLRQCDMAIFEDGKVTFYNSATNTFVPFTAEKDYVLTGVFLYEDEFCYTVSVNDELYLKKIDLSADAPAPVQLVDWGLKLSDCYNESCEKCAPMVFYSDVLMVGIEYNLDEMCWGFQDVRYYLLEEETKSDGWPEGVDDGFLASQAFTNGVHFFDLPPEKAGEETRFYYSPYDVGIYSEEEVRSVEEVRANLVCLSDKINFYEGKYADCEGEPQFEFIGCSPESDCAAYEAIMEFGTRLCFATLDGKVQKLLASDASCGWLGNNKLAFSDDEGIKTVASDGTITKLSSGKRLVTAY